MGVRLRVAGPADDASVRLLMGELMPHVDTAARHRWLHRANPDGPAVTVLATDEETGDLAGMTSVFPRRIHVSGRTVRGALGGDGWVRPRFRRRGIASLMHLASRAAMDARGLEVMFGTPTPRNATPLGKVGARDVSNVGRWVRPLLSRRLGIDRLVRDLVHPWAGSLSRTRLREAQPGDAALDVAWSDLARDVRIATVRDAAFVRWRFQDAPSGAQSVWIARDDADRVLGACALECSGRRVRIVDVIAARTRFPRVLHAAVEALQGADALEVRVDASTARALRLWRFGFVPRERCAVNVMITAADAWNGSPFRHGRAWYVTWADTDVDATWRASAVAREAQPRLAVVPASA